MRRIGVFCSAVYLLSGCASAPEPCVIPVIPEVYLIECPGAPAPTTNGELSQAYEIEKACRERANEDRAAIRALF